MRKSTIIHIHTDIKFIHNVNRFENEDFENAIILIGCGGENEGGYQGRYKDTVQYYNYSRRNLWKIIAICKTVDMVIVYDLNFAKAYIVNRLPKSVIVIWRFFGLELYCKIPHYVYSEKTLRILQERKEPVLSLGLKLQLKSYKTLLKYRAIRISEYNKATFGRADFFLGLSEQEHDFLKSKWPNLPPFLQLHMMPYLESNTSGKSRTNLIILGNNRSPYNNHLDIIDGIKKSKSKSNFEFLLMFNYGSNTLYTNTIREEASKINEIKILEDFLSIDEFKSLYSKADAFVMNGHRQMAMGSILEAFQQNIKVYLNEKNLIYHWLKENGLRVFTIENFFSDLESNNIALTYTDAAVNQQQLVKLTSKFNKHSFHNAITEMIFEGRN